MSSTENKHSPQELKKKIQELEKVLSGTKERLQEANDTLEAIRTGAVDGLVRQTPHGNQVFLLKGSEEAYRSLIERMNEGAILLSENGTILYCNESFAGLLKAPLDRVISGDITNWISKGSTKTFEELSDCIKNKAQKNVFEIAFQTAKDETVPTLVSVNRISIDSLNVIALIVTDLRVHMEEDVKRYTASLVNEITERKKAEEALTKSEKQYRQLFDSLPEGLVTVEMVYENNRAVDFRFLEVNPSYAKLIGKQSVDEVVGKTTREAVGVLEDYWYQLYDGVVKTGESVHYENYVKALDEYYEVVAWKTNENKVAILCYNVTLRKKAEEALKVSEAHYRGLFDNMGDAFMLLEVIKDKKGEPCDFRYLELNAAYEKQTGIKPSEILGKTTKEVYPDSEKYWQDVFGGVEKTGIPARFENYSAPLGRFYDTYAFPVAKNQIGVIVRDITERKKAEEELKRQLSLRNSRNIILMEVLKAKTFEDLGEACLKVAEELTGSQFGFIGEVNERGLEDIAISNPGWNSCIMYDQSGHRRPSGNFKLHGIYGRVLIDGKAFFTNDPANHPDRIGLPKGHPPLKSFIGAPLKTSDKTTGIIALANREGGYSQTELDSIESLTPVIVEAFSRKRAEEALKQRTEQLEQTQKRLEENACVLEEYSNQMESLAKERLEKLKDAERLAAIGATAGMVGHDIRNPLQAIMGDLYLMKTEVADLPESEKKESIVESLEETEKNLEYINKIVQDLQDYARPLNPKIEESDLNQVFSGILKKNGIPTNIDVSVRISKNASTLKADAYYLSRIMSNLITNAFQAMPNGGKLEIEACKEKGAMVITVADTGVGIPKDVQAKMFNVMFTTKSKGQGFGLPVVKRMTESLGGTVSFETEEGKGTKFIIRLPPPKK